MKRLYEAELMGKAYPLNLSMRATKTISERFGGIELMYDIIDRQQDHEKIDTILWLLALMLEQGAAYMRVFEEREITPPTQDELEIYYDINDFQDLFAIITKAFEGSSKTEVETASEEKNVTATQGE